MPICPVYHAKYMASPQPSCQDSGRAFAAGDTPKAWKGEDMLSTSNKVYGGIAGIL